MRLLNAVKVALCTPIVLLVIHTLLQPFYAVSNAASSSAFQGKNVTLLIAHPDDESMFFSSVLYSLVEVASVKILCLSDGGADGLGYLRTKEMYHSAAMYGIHAVEVHGAFEDSMKHEWDVNEINRALDEFITKHNGDANEIVVTFDEDGVSGHPNHVSLYKALKQQNKYKTYILASAGLRSWFKYTGPVYAIVSAVLNRLGLCDLGGLFVSDTGHYFLTLANMNLAHKTQMVWFRWGWLAYSRFAYWGELRPL